MQGASAKRLAAKPVAAAVAAAIPACDLCLHSTLHHKFFCVVHCPILMHSSVACPCGPASSWSARGWCRYVGGSMAPPPPVLLSPRSQCGLLAIALRNTCLPLDGSCSSSAECVCAVRPSRVPPSLASPSVSRRSQSAHRSARRLPARRPPTRGRRRPHRRSSLPRRRSSLPRAHRRVSRSHGQDPQLQGGNLLGSIICRRFPQRAAGEGDSTGPPEGEASLRRW